ncbi:hypothetical protein PAXRUDRAFT_584477 [Paxillus rubicundulus Ve08.2h10]|uniref:Unplaced genomic scaffold scaffold_472, whole genome shotgun sequence n=1 Tax=Paxillus rubicundulus Ve08.2h10 TaxID=930991 RepID=A0A0D0E4Q1_9AGAM|nr:hypothetical protein PAXRUDRAFT_584477 [Paxillus rubicundulus Ve08.2h10]
MDDDFSFDSSVWGAPAPAPTHSLLAPVPLTLSSPASSHDQFDDFDDFHTPLESKNPSLAHDDDFADFADFGEAGESDATLTFEDDTPFDEESLTPVPAPPPVSQLRCRPLQLDPLPSTQDLSLQIEEILVPVWLQDLSSLTTGEDIRQAEGIGQILVTPERHAETISVRFNLLIHSSRELYAMLLNSPPLMEPINWIRSRTRQQHLIALGLPVNLDEILPHSNAKPLPPLHISTRPMSLPVAPNGPIRSAPPSRSNSRAGTTRTNTPQPSARSGLSSMMQLNLGPKPRPDEKKISDLLKIEPDQLNLLPLAKLEKYLAELRSETTNTSSLLTYLLQTRDALQQDSETYNKLIAELVSEAQKSKTGKGRTAGKRSGTLS